MASRPTIKICLTVAILACAAGRANLGPITDMISPAARASTVDMAVVERPPVVAGHQIMRSADGMFYVHAMVNDRPVRFLVDTGASMVVLTASDARAVGLSIEDGKFDRSLGTVGGSAPMAWATLDKLALGGHEARNLRAVVVREGIGVSLLGQNMLAKFNSVTISANRMTIH